MNEFEDKVEKIPRKFKKKEKKKKKKKKPEGKFPENERKFS